MCSRPQKEDIDVGDRIAVLSSNNDDFLTLCGAAAKIGAIVVPVNYRLGQGEVEYILKDSGSKYIFSSKECADLGREASRPVGSIRKHYVFKTDKKQGDFIPFGTLLLNGKVAESGVVSGNHAYMIIYTAAVGGNPRGCVLSQTNMLAVGLQMTDMFKLMSTDCHIGTLPLFHIGGFSFSMAMMHQGGKNVIMDRFDPLLVLKLTQEEQGTFFGTFPPMLAAILDALDKQPVDTSSLKIVTGMDRPETIQRFLKNNPQAAFHSLYGQTEAMPVSGCDIAEKPGA